MKYFSLDEHSFLTLKIKIFTRNMNTRHRKH